MTPVATLLRTAAAQLAAAGIDSASLEARLLLAHAMGVDRTTLIDRRQAVDPTAFNALLARRLTHEPLAFITGQQGFWTLDLRVSPATLIPRADSETLISAAITHCTRPPERILDLGTGTGCLLLAALVEFPNAFGVGVDLNPAAAALAALNAKESGLATRAAFLAGSWATALNTKFDLILSNPPYIREADIADLMPEVADFEPTTALDGGPDGLAAYRVLAEALPALLTPNGLAILELGAGQADDVTAIAARQGLARVALVADLGGIPRALALNQQKTFGSEDPDR